MYKESVVPRIGSKVLAFMIQLFTLSLALGKFITYFKGSLDFYLQFRKNKDNKEVTFSF